MVLVAAGSPHAHQQPHTHLPTTVEGMNLHYFLIRLWEWIITHGLPIAALLIIGILVPRIGRFAVRRITRHLADDEEATKTRLALLGALVYVGEAVAFFFIALLILTNLGVPAAGAAIPATVISAAIGFGAQNVIGDFLAGFFIISERQFGVGDYVSFDGPNNPVEGTVVALTLRATRLRTPSGEMVNVPNGTTGVITNFSQEWSRALVDMQIPMQEGETMAVLAQKVEQAAQEAIARPDIAKDINGSLDVLPAMNLIQPIAAGQPWSVQFRITVDVSPATQWAVERAIRSSLANEFWDRMQLSTYHAGAMPPPAQTTATVTALSTDAADNGPGAPARNDAQPTGGRSSDADNATASGVAPSATINTAADPQGMDENPLRAPATTPEYDTRIKNILSLGGRLRVSTTLLIFSLIVIGGLALFSSNPEGAQAGLLNPAYWQDNQSTPTTSPRTDSTQQPQQRPSTDTTIQTPASTPTDTESPTNDGTTTGTSTPRSTTASSGKPSPTGEAQRSTTNTGATGSGAKGSAGEQPQSSSATDTSVAPRN